MSRLLFLLPKAWAATWITAPAGASCDLACLARGGCDDTAWPRTEAEFYEISKMAGLSGLVFNGFRLVFGWFSIAFESSSVVFGAVWGARRQDRSVRPRRRAARSMTPARMAATAAGRGRMIWTPRRRGVATCFDRVAKQMSATINT